MTLTESSTVHLLSAIIAISMVAVFRIPYFKRNPTAGLILVLFLNWLLHLLSVTEMRISQCCPAVQHVLTVIHKISQRAKLSTFRSISACVETLLHPIDNLFHMYQTPLTMVRAWSDANGKIDDWLTQFANPELVQAFRSFSTGITILCYAMVLSLTALGAGAAFVCIKVAVLASELLYRYRARWLEAQAMEVGADADPNADINIGH